MAYNLTRFLLSFLEETHGIRDEKVERKYGKDLERRDAAARAQARYVHPLHRQIPRMPKLSAAQYIRTIRNHLRAATSLLTLLPIFTDALSGYI